MVGLGGLEPPASPLSGVRSNQLSYRPLLAALAGRSPAGWNLPEPGGSPKPHSTKGFRGQVERAERLRRP